MLFKGGIIIIEQIDKIGEQHIYAAYVESRTPAVEIWRSVADFARSVRRPGRPLYPAAISHRITAYRSYTWLLQTELSYR